jgi:hypothetical protein
MELTAQCSVWLRAGRPGETGSISGRGEGIFPQASCVQTESGAHPASCPRDAGGPLPGYKARQGRGADHSPHLVLTPRKNRSYTSSPHKRPRGV